MKKKINIAIGVTSILSIVLFALLMCIKITANNTHEAIKVPINTLSSSIFDKQNTSYAPNEELTNTIELSDIHYLIDTYNVNCAEVNESKYLKLNEQVLEKITTTTNVNNIDERLANEMASVLSSGSTNYSYENLLTETGYKNGYECTYYVSTLSYYEDADHTSVASTVYLLSYSASIPETNYIVNMSVAVVNPDNNKFMSSSKDILDSLISTLRLDISLLPRETQLLICTDKVINYNNTEVSIKDLVLDEDSAYPSGSDETSPDSGALSDEETANDEKVTTSPLPDDTTQPDTTNTETTTSSSATDTEQ